VWLTYTISASFLSRLCLSGLSAIALSRSMSVQHQQQLKQAATLLVSIGVRRELSLGEVGERLRRCQME